MKEQRKRYQRDPQQDPEPPRHLSSLASHAAGRRLVLRKGRRHPRPGRVRTASGASIRTAPPCWEMNIGTQSGVAETDLGEQAAVGTVRRSVQRNSRPPARHLGGSIGAPPATSSSLGVNSCAGKSFPAVAVWEAGRPLAARLSTRSRRKFRSPALLWQYASKYHVLSKEYSRRGRRPAR